MASPQPEGARSSRDFYPIFIGAWLLCSLFYFIQYALRSAPGVMVPELTSAWGLNALGLSSLLGLYYYTYAAFALFAGASLDRYGAKWTIPAGVACLAAGAVLFGWGSITEAQIGRLLQGAGSAFAFVGAVYLAAHGFPARYLATAIGATQMFGMLGGSAGQFAVSPLVHGVISWQDFWLYSGVVVFILAIIMFIATPAEKDRTPAGQGTLLQMFAPYKVVLTNPQSYLCGIIGGLLFLPTTIYAMIWAVPMMVESFGLAHESAVNHVAIVPFGWAIGCPLLGYVADRIGRRKPVLIAGAAVMLLSRIAVLLLGPADPVLLWVTGLALGIGSGAAMIPYTVIKEVNPDEVKGSATGAMNFLVFIFSAVAAPAFGGLLMRFEGGGPLSMAVFQRAGIVWVAVIAIAITLTFLLRETGAAARRAPKE